MVPVFICSQNKKKYYFLIKSLSLLLLFMIILTTCSAQDRERQITNNNIYMDAGTTFIFSGITLTYERNIFLTRKSEWNVKAGYGTHVVLWGAPGDHFYFAPTFISNNKNHHFEASLGISAIFDKEHYQYYINDPDIDEPLSYFLDWYPSTYAGYRYKKPNGHFIFRAGLGWPEQLAIGIGFSF